MVLRIARINARGPPKVKVRVRGVPELKVLQVLVGGRRARVDADRLSLCPLVLGRFSGAIRV